MTTDLVDLPPRFGMDRPAFDELEGRPPGELRVATSVILARDGAEGLEVFLLQRADSMAFGAGMSVFPGGGLDAADRAAHADGLVDAQAAVDAATSWGTTPQEAAALLACAVRETYEETGVLFADVAPPAPGTRARLAAREIGLHDVVGRVAADRLRPWARWLTPEVMPRRYDTAFFVAAVPEGQEPDGDTSEAVGAGWCAPARALREWDAGDRALMPPTWAVLTELAAAPDVAGLLAAAAGRRPEPVTPSLRPGGERVGIAVPGFAIGAAR